MESKITEIMKNMEILYENIFNLLKANQQLDSQNVDTIEVTLKKLDGTSEIVEVKSFQYLKKEIERISSNFNNIINENNTSYFLNSDGSLTKYLRTTFANAERIEVNGGITFDNQCNPDYTSLISDFIYPTVKLPIFITSAIKGNVICRSYIITEGWDNIADNITYLAFKNLIQNADIIANNEIVRELTPEKTQITYYGKFKATSVNYDSNTNQYTVVFDTVKYGGLNVNGNNINLVVNDEIISATTMSKYRILNINTYNNTVVLVPIEGINETINVNDFLYYDQLVDNDIFKIGIPVKPNQQIVVFLSTINDGIISYPSDCLKLDTSTYTINYNNDTYTIDEFFTNYVVNISDYLLNMVNENSVPNSLGIKPATPLIDTNNFKVIQINKHLNTGTSVDNINRFNTQKQEIQNKIQEKENTISELNNGLISGIYTTITEKNKAQNDIVTLYSDINILNQQLLVLSRKIDDEANKASLKNTKPKYKIAGYWTIQNDIYSPSVGHQNIVKYDVWYRYLNQNTGNVETTTLKMSDGNNEISVVFTPWNKLDTESLTKVLDVNNRYVWATTQNNDVDNININQCLIPISNNESVEIKIRAISEAGYPLNPVKSEWSNIINIKFPDYLRENSTGNIITTNETDLKNSEFTSILDKKGLLTHITSQITENEKVYHHLAQYITSGLYTDEMKHIPLDVAIKTLRNDVNEMLTQSITMPTISVIAQNEEYFVYNNQELQLVLGSIRDIDTTLVSNHGKIFQENITIKITNKNQQPIELKSLFPLSTLMQDYSNLDSIYKLVPVICNSPLEQDTVQHQDLNQIIYFRTVDMSLIENNNLTKFFDTQTALTPISYTTGNISDITTNTVYDINGLDEIITDPTPNENLVQVLKAKLNRAITYNDMNIAKSYQRYISGNTTEWILNGKYQLSLEDGTDLKLPSFDIDGDPDYFLDDSDIVRSLTGVGSCGAILYPTISKNCFTNIGVNAMNSRRVKTTILHQNEYINIPLTFKYRPIDALGHIGGHTTRTTKESYTKALGVSMMINNAPFLFDIKCKFNL